MTVLLKSKEQLLGEIVRKIRNNSDISDFKSGGALVTALEAISKQIYSTQVDVLKILEMTDVNSLVGTRLDDLAQTIKLSNGQGGTGRKPATQASGNAIIGSSFTKISTRAYAGKPAPFAGSSVLYVQDASGFSASGQLYVGRNTVGSFEGPINYSSIVNTGSYYEITLSGPLTKDHAYTDEVTFAQGGDRTIQAGTIVQIPQNSDNSAVQFSTNLSVIIPDGEAEIAVSVTCGSFGNIGNAPALAISEFVGTAPFTGATVKNNVAFVNGQDTESDSSLRQRIVDYPNTLARGTVGAIAAALLSVQDAETKTSVTSQNVIRPIKKGDPTLIYIDDGSVLQPVFIGQDYELLLAQASGLEQSFRTAQAPITPAIVLGAANGPFSLTAGQTVTFVIDNVPYIFPNSGGIQAENYKDLLSATPYEIIRDFNSLPDSPLEFRVFNAGQSIVAIDKTNSSEEISVSAGDLQGILGFSTDIQRPIYLYKNAVLQSFRGKTATITTQPFTSWVFQTSYTGLSVEVDNVAVAISDITNADFTQFSTTIATASADQWRQVLQAKIPGVTVVFQNGQFVISSNKTNSSSSQLKIVAGNWIAGNGLFATAVESVGSSKDYDFNRYTGDIRFVSKLAAGDIVEIASENTRAYVQSSTTSTGLYDLASQSPGFGNSKFVVAFDGTTAVKGVGTLSSAVLKVTDSSATNRTVTLQDLNANGIFDNAEVGDYLYLVRNTGTTDITIPSGNQIPAAAAGMYRIKSFNIASGGTDEAVIEVSSSQAAAFVLNTEFNVPVAGMVNIFSSTTIPQVIELTSGTANMQVEDVVTAINSVIVGGTAYRNGAKFFRIRSNTFDGGKTSVLASVGKISTILAVDADTSLQAHVANSTSGQVDGGIPVITRVVPPGTEASGYAARAYLEIYKNYTDLTGTSVDPVSQSSSNVSSYPVGFQETWVTGKLLGWTGRSYNNSTVSPFAGFTRSDKLVPPVGPVDNNTATVNKYSNLSFRLEDSPTTNSDKFVVEMDLDAENKTVTVPMFKKATINSMVSLTSAGKGKVVDFTLKDPEDANKLFFDATSPYKNFDFNDFRLLTKSVGVYKADSANAGSDLAVVLRSTSFGGASRYRLVLNLPQTPSKGAVSVSHYNRFNDSEVETIVAAEMSSQATTAGSTIESGNYSVTSVSTVSTNLKDVTISTFTPAVAANAQNGTVLLNANITGPARNGTIVNIIDTGSGGLSLGAETLNVVTNIDLGGTTPSISTFNTAISGSVNLGAATGSGNVQLQPFQPGYQPSTAALVIAPGGNNITFSMSQSVNTPKTKGEAGNNWTITVIASGAGVPVATRSGNDVTINLRSGTLALSAVQTLLNTDLGATYIDVLGAGPGNIAVFTTEIFAGGIDEKNTLTLQNGAVADNGLLGTGYAVNSIIQVGGVQSNLSMPVGAWPITAVGAGTVTFRVPDYIGLASINGITYQATDYPLQAYALLLKTAQDIADAINAYLPDSPVATAQALGAGAATTNFLIPSGSGIPKPTYINYENTSSLPSYVVDPSNAYTFHAFSNNFGGVASIHDYDSAGTSIKATVQTIDSIFPTTTQAVGTTYTPVNEEVYLVPSNASTIARWMEFPPTSSLTVNAIVERTENASQVQLSSKKIGSDGAVSVKSTAANDLNFAIAGAASTSNSSSFVPVLTSQARSIPRRALMKVENAVTTDLRRPLRVLPTGTSVTAANTANIDPWLRPNARLRYEQGSTTTRGRMIFLRNGQAPTGFGFSASEPLSNGNIVVTANSPSTGLATVTLSGGTGSLSARVGDMLYVKPGSALAIAGLDCPDIGTGTKVMSSTLYGTNPNPQMTAYPGYPVVQVNGTNEVVIVAPNIASNVSSTAIGSSTDLVFVPVLFTEKNIRTKYVAGPFGAEMLEDTITSGTHAAKYQISSTNQDFYAILKKLNGPFYALVASNTVDEGSLTDLPDASLDDLLLDKCLVNTDDYVHLKGFGSVQDGEYRLVAHDGKNAMVLYRETAQDDIVLSDVQTDLSGTYTVGIAQWGRRVQSQVINSQSGTLTLSANTVSGLTTTDGLQVGDAISGTGVPTGTVIKTIVSNSAITMSNNSTVNGSSTLAFSRTGQVNYGYNPSQYDMDPRPVRIVDADSVIVGSKIKISQATTGTTTWFDQSILGSWNIVEIGYFALGGPGDIAQYVEFDLPAGAPSSALSVTVDASNVSNVGFTEREPFVGFRFVQGWSIDPADIESSQLYLSPARSFQKISDAYGTELTTMFKLGYETSPLTGIDGYKIFGGLIREAHRTIDGVPSSITQFNGVKSSGTDVSILPPVPRSVSFVLKIKTRDGVSVNVIAQVIRSSVATFIAGLGIGSSVVLSDIIATVQAIPGVTSVEITATTPVAVDAVIPVGDNETAVVIDPETDIEVGQ